MVRCRLLKEIANKRVDILKPGGRLSVITYHSLEDRIVKNIMKAGNIEGKIEQRLLGRINTPFKLINNKVIVPTDEEQEQNPRSRRCKTKNCRKEMKETETNKPLEVIDVVEIPQEALDEAEKKQQTANNNAANDTQEPSEELPTLKEIIENRAIEGERPMSKNFTLQTVLGGDILTAAILRRQIWLIVLITFFVFLYIANRYRYQQQMIEYDKLKKELQDAKYKALSSSSELTEKSRESNVLEMLKSYNDSTIKIASEPPYIITIPEE